MLNKLWLWQKFALLGMLGLALVSVPLTLYIRSANEGITIAENEAIGIEPSRRVIRVIQLTQQHRGLSAGALGGNASLNTARALKQTEVTQELVAATAALKRAGADGELIKWWEGAAGEWKQLASNLERSSVSGTGSFTAHTALIERYLEILDKLADDSGLSLDPEYTSYHLMMAAVAHMPALSEILGQLRGRGTGVLARKELKADERASIDALMARARERFRTVEASIDKALKATPVLNAKLGGAAKEGLANRERVTRLATDEILAKEVLSYSPEQYFNSLTQVIDAQFVINAATLDALDSILRERVTTLTLQRRLTVVGVLLLALICALVGWAISRSITRPLGEAVKVAQRVAQGELTVQVQAGGRNETGQLLTALSGMTQNLRVLVGEVAAGARTVSDTSAQIAQGNLDLSQRTEEQAGTLEETASAIEELTSTVGQNAENARQASQLAVGASEVARKGGEVVGHVVSTMTDISASSRKISDIISVIDGIAFQTNILALNAAVEAARAGEQGRGFAVVATEVRNLAQRSATAAKEIKTLIGASVEKVDAGTRLVDAAGKTMEEIVGSVRQVSDLIAEIAAASQEQSTGIGQVNTAITQMDQVVQQNASLVEEATAATESMKEQAGALLQMVSRFRLDAPGASAEAAAPVDAAPPPAATPASPRPIRVKAASPRSLAAVPTLGASRYAGVPQGEWREF